MGTAVVGRGEATEVGLRTLKRKRVLSVDSSTCSLVSELTRIRTTDPLKLPESLPLQRVAVRVGRTLGLHNSAQSDGFYAFTLSPTWTRASARDQRNEGAYECVRYNGHLSYARSTGVTVKWR